MITAIIIDDELHCIKRLEHLLIGLNDVIELCGSYQTINDGLTAIKQIKPQLIFLDVEISSNETGFDILKKLPLINFDVIFTTAYDKYAVEAFKFSAIDYLLKPVDENELVKAINKLQEKISTKQSIKKFENLFFNLNAANTSKKICIPVVNGFEFISLNNIIRCESEINYTTLFIKNNHKLTVSKTLKEFEEMLHEYNFYRVHNSHLINIDHIKSYNKRDGGIVMMDDGSEIEISVRRKDGFLKRLTSA